MSEPKHTKTPWHIAAHSDGAFNSCIRDNKGWSVAYITGCKAGTDPRGDANAEMIVRAVNSHEALMAALETIAGVWDEHPGDVIAADDILNPHMMSIQVVVRAALAAGRGEA